MRLDLTSGYDKDMVEYKSQKRGRMAVIAFCGNVLLDGYVLAYPPTLWLAFQYDALDRFRLVYWPLMWLLDHCRPLYWLMGQYNDLFLRLLG